MNYRDTSQSIEDFAQMAENYNTTKPVISKNHTAEDNIRPVGRRSRKHEHMIKVSARQYMIWDGYSVGDPKFKSWSSNVPPTPEQTLALAPIVWTLSPKGDIETVRIRNGSGDYAHCSRYTFLDNTLPRGLAFHVHNGKQYISINHYEQTGWVDDIKKDNVYLLPKSDYHPDYVGDTKRSKDDKKYLTFARKVGGDRNDWKVIGDTWDIRGSRKQVNKKAKAEIKPYADAFYEWITTMYRMIPFTDHEYQRKRTTEMGTWAVEQGLAEHRWDVWNNKKLMSKIANEAFRDDQHPMRLHLAVDFLAQSNLNGTRYYTVDAPINEPETKEDVSKLRSQWNRYVNSKLNLVKELEAEKIVKGGK